jgi:hypothetical protein
MFDASTTMFAYFSMAMLPDFPFLFSHFPQGT